MSGSLIGGVIGAAIGFVASGFNPVGAQWGWIAGSMAGGLLMPGSLPDQFGPRLQDLMPQSSEYGRPVPIVYGAVGIAGNVIWASDIVEVATTTEQGGGKGGGPSVSTTTYAYYGNFAVSFCEGERNVGKIWAGPAKRLIYDGGKPEGGSIRIYTGSESQLPDPLIESFLGVGNMPAYRGICYVVFENFPLAKDGNMLPFITAEVFERWGPAPPSEKILELGSYALYSVIDKETGYLWTYDQGNFSSRDAVYVMDPIGRTLITTIHLGNSSLERMVFMPSADASIPSQVLVSTDGPLTNTLYFINTNDYSVSTASTGSYAPLGYDPAGTLWMGSQYALTSTVKPYGGTPFTLSSLLEYLTYIPADAEIMDGGRLFYGSGWGRAFILDSSLNVLLRVDHGSAMYSPYQEHMTYDTLRKVVWWLPDVTLDVLVKFDLVAGTTALVDLPAGLAILNNIHYHPATDTIYAGVYGSTHFYGLDPQTFEIRRTYSTTHSPVGNNGSYFTMVDAPGYNDRLYAATGSGAYVLYLQGPAGPVTLSSIVADLSVRAGLTTSNVNVEALNDLVDGYAIARQTTVRAAIDALRPAYFFDAVESSGVVKYVKRGGAVAVVVPDEDLAAHDAGSQSPDPLFSTRQMEVELPRILNVNYLLAATDYSAATKLSKRLIGSSGEESTLDMPLVLSETKAQQIAEVNLHGAWVQRLAYRFALPKKYAYLEPTDLVVVKGYTMRLLKITSTPRGVLQCEAVADDVNYYVPNVVVTETPSSGKVVAVPGLSRLELM